MSEAMDGEWRSRPWLSVLVRVVVYGIPLLTGSLVARSLTGALGAWPHRYVSVLLVLMSAILVSLAVSGLTNRLLPLAVLLRMTMIFPDKAPSRFKVARRTTSMADIAARLESPRLDEKDAATTMLALVTALGRHDRQTRGHSERVRLFTDLIAEQLRLSGADVGRLRWAALIHDIGKLQVPVSVLNKPGRPNAGEWKLLQTHPDAGARLASPLAEWLGPWFDGIAHHHERYDGTGYPRGLVGDQISFAGRVVAVVDSFETMTAARSYKAARSTLSARTELARCAGTHFDPAVVRAFLAIALPRLLWAVGFLAFLVNVPFLRWIGSVRIADAVGTTAQGAANMAGVSALAVAVGASPTAAVAVHGHGHSHHDGHAVSTVEAVDAQALPAISSRPTQADNVSVPAQRAATTTRRPHSAAATKRPTTPGTHRIAEPAPSGAPVTQPLATSQDSPSTKDPEAKAPKGEKAPKVEKTKAEKSNAEAKGKGKKAEADATSDDSKTGKSDDGKANKSEKGKP